MRKFTMTGIVLVTSLAQVSAWADAETEAAVQEVQTQMKSPQFHENAAKENPQAQAVEKYVKETAGSAQSEQEIYNLAAEILGNMKDQSPEAMMNLLKEAQANPEAFAQKWNPEQKKKLSELSSRLPAANKKTP